MRRFFRNLFGGAAETKHQRTRLALDYNPTVPIYAIGDIHGCYDQMQTLLARIYEDGANIAGTKPIIILGDLVDRGPGSQAVLDHFLRPAPLGFEFFVLCGNHEEAFLDFLKAPDPNSGWLKFGGEETLQSYGLDLAYLLRRTRDKRQVGEFIRQMVPSSHIQFMEKLPSAISCGPFLFVHAGIAPGYPIEEQDDDDLMTMREPFLSEGPKLDLTVIHGHTPNPEPSYAPGRIGIDTGAYMTGRLTCLKLVGGRAQIL